MSCDQADLSDNVNVVMFCFHGSTQVAAAQVTADADDAFRQAWQEVVRSRPMAPEQVGVIVAQWEPSAEDREFIERSFPNLRQLTCAFPRPEPGQWAQALKNSAAIFDQAAAMLEAEADPVDAQAAEANSLPETDPIAAEPVLDETEPAGQALIPMLRTSPPPAEMAAVTLRPDHLYVAVAAVSANDRGTQDLLWMTHAWLDEVSMSFEDVLGVAYANLHGNLRIVTCGDDDHSELMLDVEGSDPVYLPAAAIVLPDFREQMTEFLGGDRFLAAVPCHDRLHVMRADSPMAHVLEKIVLESEHFQDELLPTLFLIEPDGLRILAQATRGSA